MRSFFCTSSLLELLKLLKLLIPDIFDGGVELGLEVAVIVLAKHFLVGHTADAFQYLSVKRSLERGSVDIMAHGHNVAERPAIGKVDIGYRLQPLKATAATKVKKKKNLFMRCIMCVGGRGRGGRRRTRRRSWGRCREG